MVLRSEIDMREIKMEFQKKYSKTLESFIKVRFYLILRFYSIH
jgi:hypothetical protein